jgi:hypothetical protein
MPVDPDELTPSAGIVLRTAGSAAPPLLRPVSHDCRAGTVPELPADPAVSVYTAQKTPFRRRQAEIAARGGCVFVIGDSQLQLLDVTMFSPFAVPFTAGADTAAGYINHMVSDYTALANCGGVVLQVTQNDITGGETLANTKVHWDKILAYLTGPLVIIEAYPLTSPTHNANLAALNAHIAAAVAGRPLCEVVSINDEIVDGSGNLLASLTWENDGQHVVDPASLRLLASRVRAALRRVTAA